jgi:hypothetical protein
LKCYTGLVTLIYMLFIQIRSGDGWYGDTGPRKARVRRFPGPAGTVGALLLLLAAIAPTVSAGGSGESSATESPGQAAPAEPVSGNVPDTPPVPAEELPQQHLGQGAPGRAGAEFTTDFSRATVSFEDILSGGPPRDGIPSIDEPRFVSLRDARDWLSPREPVIVVTARSAGSDGSNGSGETRIYPLQILTWHEIVNDTIAGIPVAVTYCPLCNTGVSFRRDPGGHVLDFGTTGRLRFSNLIMYDRQTESWWQQASGDAIAGFYAGRRLTFVPTTMLPFSRAAETYPEATVLSRETGHPRGYGRNPYVGYDSSERPFLYRGPDTGSTYNPLERVVSIEENGEVAYAPYDVLQTSGHVPLEVGGTPFVVIWEAGTASALDSGQIADGRDVGTANVFVQQTVRGRAVRFSPVGESNGTTSPARTSDDGTVWNAAGRGTAGPLEGEFLEPAAGVQHFWFSHAALVEGLE